MTGSDLDLGSSAARSYTSYLKKNEAQAISAMKEVAPQATVRSAQRVVYGGLAATVPANKVKDILKIDGVVAVQKDVLHKQLTDSSAAFLNAGPVYAQLGGKPNAGKGVIYGNLDSGVWPEHPSFADQGNLVGSAGHRRRHAARVQLRRQPADAGHRPVRLPEQAHRRCALHRRRTTPNQGDDIYAGTARDADGHGTHTTSTSAGNPVASAPIFGVDRGPLAGMAPGAWVMEYKVCGPAGCFSSDSSAAVAQAILDGVDVINYSISGGTDPSTDPVELAFLDAYAAGVFVAASAGNDGPGASTANHLSPWVTTVAASTQTREFASKLTLTAPNGDIFSGQRRLDHRRRGSAAGGAGLGRAVQPCPLRRPGARRDVHRARSSPASAAATAAWRRATTSSRAAPRAWSSTTPPCRTPRPTTTGCRPSTSPTAPSSRRSWPRTPPASPASSPPDRSATARATSWRRSPRAARPATSSSPTSPPRRADPRRPDPDAGQHHRRSRR